MRHKNSKENHQLLNFQSKNVEKLGNFPLIRELIIKLKKALRHNNIVQNFQYYLQ